MWVWYIVKVKPKKKHGLYFKPIVRMALNHAPVVPYIGPYWTKEEAEEMLRKWRRKHY